MKEELSNSAFFQRIRIDGMKGSENLEILLSLEFKEC